MHVKQEKEYWEGVNDYGYPVFGWGSSCLFLGCWEFKSWIGF